MINLLFAAFVTVMAFNTPPPEIPSGYEHRGECGADSITYYDYDEICGSKTFPNDEPELHECLIQGGAWINADNEEQWNELWYSCQVER